MTGAADRKPLRMAMFAAAMRVKADTFERGDLGELRSLAARSDPDWPEVAALRGFVDLVERGFQDRDAAARLRAAQALADYVEAVAVPVPPDLQRRDIYG